MTPLTITIAGITRVINGVAYLVTRDDTHGEVVIPIGAAPVMDGLLKRAGVNDDIGGEPVFISIVFPNIDVNGDARLA